MITLEMKEHRAFIAGEVVHFKVTSIYMQAPGRWRLTVEDVTPLPGAEPTGYGCRICGIIEAVQPDGSLPEGWTEKKYEQGSCFFCRDDRDAQICRVCGCTNKEGCLVGEGTEVCHWVEPDLCSACVKKQ